GRWRRASSMSRTARRRPSSVRFRSSRRRICGSIGELDYHTAAIQELAGALERSVRVPVTDDPSVGLEYAPVLTRRNMLAGFGAASAVAISSYATLGAVDALVSAAYAAQAGLATPALLPNIAALRAVSRPIGLVASVSGYHEPGDG